jgi:hypothetical protein
MWQCDSHNGGIGWTGSMPFTALLIKWSSYRIDIAQAMSKTAMSPKPAMAVKSSIKLVNIVQSSTHFAHDWKNFSGDNAKDFAHRAHRISIQIASIRRDIGDSACCIHHSILLHLVRRHTVSPHQKHDQRRAAESVKGEQVGKICSKRSGESRINASAAIPIRFLNSWTVVQICYLSNGTTWNRKNRLGDASCRWMWKSVPIAKELRTIWMRSWKRRKGPFSITEAVSGGRICLLAFQHFHSQFRNHWYSKKGRLRIRAIIWLGW